MLYLRKKKMVELCTRDINKCKITNWKKRSKTADWENPLRMGRSALDCSAIWEGGEGGGGGGEEEEGEEEYYGKQELTGTTEQTDVIYEVLHKPM